MKSTFLPFISPPSAGVVGAGLGRTEMGRIEGKKYQFGMGIILFLLSKEHIDFRVLK